MRYFFTIIIINMSLMNVFSQSISKQDSLDIDKLFYFYEGNFPGAILGVYQNDKTVFEKVYGSANIETKEKLTSQHYFYFGKMRRIVTMLAIMNLYEKGKLDLNEPLSSVFEKFPAYGNKITIRNLLEHTSGLKSFEGTKKPKEVLDFLLNSDSLNFETGTHWGYSNSDLALLILLVEKKSKKSYYNYTNRKVYRKLRIKPKYLDKCKKEKLMRGHKALSLYSYNLVDELSRLDEFGQKNVFLSIRDFKKLNDAFFSKKTFLKSETNKLIFQRINNRINFGLGWYVIKKDDHLTYWMGSNGNNFENVWVHLPESNVTVFLVTNRNQSRDSILKRAIYIARLVK
ncbi:MAG: beta-lactamase family protein [Bacteroidales bacterium]|nr:beta-lactamase family protein [Bacteroidales bacterium]